MQYLSICPERGCRDGLLLLVFGTISMIDAGGLFLMFLLWSAPEDGESNSGG